MNINEVITYIKEETDMKLEKLEEDYSVHIDMIGDNERDVPDKYKLTNGQGVTIALTEDGLIDFIDKMKNPKMRESTIPKFWE